jgi:hypothetical protein
MMLVSESHVVKFLSFVRWTSLVLCASKCRQEGGIGSSSKILEVTTLDGRSRASCDDVLVRSCYVPSPSSPQLRQP